MTRKHLKKWSKKWFDSMICFCAPGASSTLGVPGVSGVPGAPGVPGVSGAG